MTIVTEIVASITPQVVFAMGGGAIGAVFGIVKNEYSKTLSVLLVAIGVVVAGAVGDYLSSNHNVQSIFIVGASCIPVGLVSGFLMDALEIASPTLAKKLVDTLGNKAIDNIADK